MNELSSIRILNHVMPKRKDINSSVLGANDRFIKEATSDKPISEDRAKTFNNHHFHCFPAITMIERKLGIIQTNANSDILFLLENCLKF